MNNNDLKQEISSTKVIVHRGRYAYLQTKELDFGAHFLITQDKDEITIVTKEENLPTIQSENITKWFKLIEFKVTKPFLCVGFLAKISSTIAAKNLNILLVSTYSKDYALINENGIDEAIKALKEEGFKVDIE